MVQNPPQGMSRVTPYLFYNDVASAINWLVNTFGFKKGLAMPGPDGKLMHAEMIFDDGVVMLGAANDEYPSKSPKELPAIHQSLYVYVDHLDTHYANTKKTGAEIRMEPEEMFWGDRIYSACDIEGHHWTFAQHVKDVPPEEMQPPTGS